MKFRSDFVTNSSSSSFILTNNSNETLSSEEFAKKLFVKILEDAKGRFELKPGESITIECGDNPNDGAFEMYIHENFNDWELWRGDYFMDDDIQIEFKESHH